MFYCFSRLTKPPSNQGIIISMHYFYRITGDILYMHVAHFDPTLLLHVSLCLKSHLWSPLPLPKWSPFYFSAFTKPRFNI